MPEILDIIDTTGDPEGQLTSTRKNFATLSKQALKSGTFLLVDISSATVLNSLAATTYTPISGFSGSFNSSGGLVFVDGSIVVNSVGVIIYLALFIDDVESGWGICYDGVNGIENVKITRWLQLNSGTHKWQIKYKLSASTATIGNAITKSTLSIIEFLRG